MILLTRVTHSRFTITCDEHGPLGMNSVEELAVERAHIHRERQGCGERVISVTKRSDCHEAIEHLSDGSRQEIARRSTRALALAAARNHLAKEGADF